MRVRLLALPTWIVCTGPDDPVIFTLLFQNRILPELCDISKRLVDQFVLGIDVNQIADQLGRWGLLCCAAVVDCEELVPVLCLVDDYMRMLGQIPFIFVCDRKMVHINLIGVEL